MANKKYNLNALNEEFGEVIISEYLSGVHASDLAQKYLNNAKDFRYINYILQMNNIPIRTRSEVKKLSDKVNQNPNLNGRQFQVNSDYFKTWSYNMAYILGYIATDGNVSQDRVLKLALQKQDRPLLEKIKDEIEFTGNIYNKEIHLKSTDKDYESSYMNIYDREICSDLKKLNIISNKSLVLGRFDFIPDEYEMNFLLGVFDGDGSVGQKLGDKCKNSIQIRLRYFSASLEFIEYIKDTMEKHGFSEVKIREEKRKNDFYSLCYSTKDSIKFYEDAYSNGTIWLDRKKEKFEYLINKRKEYEESKQNPNILKVKTV